MKRWGAAAIAWAGMLQGCTTTREAPMLKEAYRLDVRNEKGRVASGDLRIDGDDGSARLEIDGTTNDLGMLLGRKMPAGQGRFQVRIRGDEAIIRLLPEVVDDELVFVGRLEGLRLVGSVIHATDAGGRVVGRFLASPLP